MDAIYCSTVVETKDSYPVLFLSSGHEPMFRTNWKRAITAVLGGRAEIIEAHGHFKILTSSGAIPFPVVVKFTTGIILGKMKKIDRSPKITKRNVWSRDRGACQYCATNLSLSEATIDHVVPKSKGGSHAWTNVALACSKCNQKKGSKLLENLSINLYKQPGVPTIDKVLFRR